MLPNFDVLTLFLFVLVRITAFLIAAPFFSLTSFPLMVKAGFALTLAAILTPVLPLPDMNFSGVFDFGLLLAKEIGVGLAMGFVCTLIMNAMSVGGQFIDIKIGFFASQMFDPLSGGQSGIVSRFLLLLGLVFFVSANAHHEIISALAGSFEVVPPEQAGISGAFALVLIRAFADMMILAVKLTAPIMAVVLAIDISLGLVGRTAPQMDIFMLGFPIKIILGILTLSILVPIMGAIFDMVFDLMEKDLLLLLRGLT